MFNSFGADSMMATAPMGAVMSMTSTAMVSTMTPSYRKSSLLSFSGSILVAASKATPPMAACTVALGSQASATNSRSLVVRPPPRTQKKETTTRTERPTTSTRRPYPMVAGSSFEIWRWKITRS